RRHTVIHLVVSLALAPPPSSALFPYTTLFRSKLPPAYDESWASTQQFTSSQNLGYDHGTAYTSYGPPPPSYGSGDRQPARRWWRSEEHTSELQSQSNLVCRLLLEKKK